MSWKLLERFLSSEIFSNNPSICVAYLSRYAHHVGIQYVLCNKLRSFSYAEIEFFLPQLCHLLVSIESESMALEDFIIDLCHESVSGALITFWLFQAALHDLKSDPQSNAFRTCRRLHNKAQSIVFGATYPQRAEKIFENPLPTTVLASIVLASVAAPSLPASLGPLAISQARRPRPADDTISEAPQVQSKLSRSNTHTVTSSKSRRRSTHSRLGSKESAHSFDEATRPARPGSSRKLTSAGKQSASRAGPHSRDNSISQAIASNGNQHGSTASLPDVARTPASVPDTNGFPFPRPRRPTLEDRRRHSHTVPGEVKPRPGQSLTREQQSNVLRAHYFKSETAFLQALEDISIRLVALPKQARLSALRAELALVARDLPAEVDIPVIEPATLEAGLPSQSKHHRIVRLNPAESTSLNSAERVPYLLIVEVLREDFDFDPDSDANQRLLAALVVEKKGSRRRLFDISGASKITAYQEPLTANVDSVFEPALGDLSSADLLQDYAANGTPLRADTKTPHGSRSLGSRTPPRLSSGANTISSYSMLSTPRTSEMIPLSRSDSPTPRHMSAYGAARDQPDFSALATHMRTAAQMLAQLDISSSKRPRQEVEAIKAKIIANMRTLEEQNFNNADGADDADATFDAILSHTAAAVADSHSLSTVAESSNTSGASPTPGPIQNDGRGTADPAHDTAAGIARTENDQKTGGLRPRAKGDREDPSYALFGEDWASKRERIRRTSPYGFMRNWDLLSLIVKTGSDLRQELFACQLIRIAANIWSEAKVGVWVRTMRILVTGESSGLIETITNGVSLHSIKRSLTLASIAAGTNPRRRFATLKDHFVKTFGDEDSPSYAAARAAFAESLAAYSVLSYVLQLKDRHNGNLLIDNAGHVIHIDFGFMLGNSPGSMGFEAAPFKLTAEYVEVLGGVGAAGYERFVELCKAAFLALRKRADQIVSVVELMGKDSRMACFAGQGGGVAGVVSGLKGRFALTLSEREAERYVEELVGKSLGSYYTRLYDVFQYRTQGIY